MGSADSVVIFFSAHISGVSRKERRPRPRYPLRPSANGRYVVDSNNVPFS